MPEAHAEERLRPPLTLVLGPAGAGKTEWVLARFLNGDGRALLVVSSPDQAETRAAQIAARSGQSDKEVRGQIFSFHSLVAEIGKAAPDDGSRTIGRAFQRLILAELLPRTLRADDFLGRMLEAPGFVGALAERIREWKLALITPDALEQGATAASELLDEPHFPVKARELARLFRAYQTFLTQNRLHDEEDRLCLAAARVAENAAPLPYHADQLLVDGFYRFNRAQRALLASIAGRGVALGKPEVAVAVTLPYDPARPLLFAAPERTLAYLRSEFTTQEETLPPRADIRPPVLSRLESGLFGGDPPPVPLPVRSSLAGEGEPDTHAADLSPSPRNRKASHDILPSALQGEAGAQRPVVTGVKVDASTLAPPPQRGTSERGGGRGGGLPLQLFDAPNPYVEAEMVAREFRRLYEAGGRTWSDFAVVLRTLGDYAPILSAVFERYEIPLGVDGPEKLADNPLLKTLLHFFAVVRYGWQRDDVIAFLKSGYTAPTKLAADALRRRAQAACVREGRDRWLALVQDDPAEEGSVAETLRAMAYWEDLLTHERGSPSDFAERVQEILTAFGLTERIATGDPVRQKRDQAALKEAQEVLWDVAQMAEIAGRVQMTFAAFHTELLAAWESASAIAPMEGDRVRVVEPYDARERPLKVAAVMGLTERVFPRRITEDPFLRDEERTALRKTAGLDLEEQRGRADDERFFFYLAVTAPSESLILSFPRSSDESDTLPSFYLDEVRAVFPDGVPTASRTLADVAPQPDEVVSANDRLLAACAGLFDPGAEADSAARAARLRQAAALMQACLQSDSASASASPLSRSVGEAEAQRLVVTGVRASWGEVSGMGANIRAILASRHLPRLPRLEAEELRADFAGQKPVYSVSELETYRRCPFQYLLRHVLQLRPEEDGTSPRKQGTLLHGVLRRYFRQRQAQPPTPDLPTMRAELNALLAETLAEAALDAGPHHLRMTERMLADALAGFAEREHRFAPQFGMEPAHFELAFGVGVVSAERIEEEERETDGPPAHDPASCPEPLRILAQDGGPPVEVCGSIDRVDRDPTGQRALVLDYKLSKSVDYSAMLRGDSLQMPLYLLAMERLFGMAGAVACYDAMREPGRRRLFRTEHVNIRQFAPITPLEDGTTVKPLNREQYAELIKTAETAAVQAARSIAAGRIEATPGEHCHACPYGDVCRTTLTGGHDGEALLPMPGAEVPASE